MEFKETSAAEDEAVGGGDDPRPSSPARPPATAPIRELTANLQHAASRVNGRHNVGGNGSGNLDSAEVELIRKTLTTRDSDRANPVVVRAMTRGLM